MLIAVMKQIMQDDINLMANLRAVWVPMFFTAGIVLSCITLSGCIEQRAQSKPMHLDTLIINGAVYNGHAAPARVQSIGIRGNKIAFVGDHSKTAIQAGQIVDAEGLLVSPGFIDPHTHSYPDLANPKLSSNINYLTQGVTTVFAGNDGGGSPHINQQFARLAGGTGAGGTGTNVALFAGHGTIRQEVMGRVDRSPTTDELLAMKALLKQAMNQGALGLSTGLFYVPGSYSKTDEVIELAKVAAEYGGVYESHIRDESTYNIGVIAAIEELIKIGEQADIPVHIAHIKALGVDVWGKSENIIQRVEHARMNGIKVTVDQYPWRASSTGIHKAVVSSWVLSGAEQEIQARLNNPELLPRIKREMKENIRRRGGAESLLIVVSPDRSL